MASDQSQVAHRVLLVDDDGAVRGMMSEMLERKGLQVVAAASVTAVLAYIAQRALTFSSPTCICPMPETASETR
jgi:CheY-like chemotaxis protein